MKPKEEPPKTNSTFPTVKPTEPARKSSYEADFMEEKLKKETTKKSDDIIDDYSMGSGFEEKYEDDFI